MATRLPSTSVVGDGAIREAIEGTDVPPKKKWQITMSVKRMMKKRMMIKIVVKTSLLISYTTYARRIVVLLVLGIME